MQKKTGDPWESELFSEVKGALLDYIQNVRPKIEGCSQVFMTLMIPYKPVDCGVINTMVWGNVSAIGNCHFRQAKWHPVFPLIYCQQYD